MANVLELIATAESMPPAPPLKVGTLPETLADYRDADDEKVNAAWGIETVTAADWALSRVAALEAEIREIDAQAKAAKARIDAKAAQLKAAVERGVGFFRFKLMEYAERNRAALLGGGKKKSRSMLHGTIGWRSSPERLVVTDEKALEAWLVTQPVESGLYRQVIEADKRALQELHARTGEIPPGCDIKPETDEPYVKAEAPETALAKGDK